jgi:hypothetical protein
MAEIFAFQCPTYCGRHSLIRQDLIRLGISLRNLYEGMLKDPCPDHLLAILDRLEEPAPAAAPSSTRPLEPRHPVTERPPFCQH